MNASVKGVTNDINIKLILAVMDIQAKIESALKRNAELDAKNVTIESGLLACVHLSRKFR